MPTIDQVDAFILRRITNASRRPLMFASPPSAFEDLLVNWDLIRAFLHDMLDETGYIVEGKGYLNYLLWHGYGTATVAVRLHIDHGGSVPDSEVLEVILREWNSYMNSDFSF